MQKCFSCHAACHIQKIFVKEIVALRMENGYLQENVCSSSYVCRAILPIDKAIDYRIALNNSLEKICD